MTKEKNGQELGLFSQLVSNHVIICTHFHSVSCQLKQKMINYLFYVGHILDLWFQNSQEFPTPKKKKTVEPILMLYLEVHLA